MSRGTATKSSTAAQTAALAPSDPLLTKDQLAQVMQSKLDHAKARLAGDPTSQELALEVVDCIVRVLRSGAPDRHTLLTLATFVLAHQVEFGRTILGVSFEGRSRADTRKRAARDAFEWARHCGLSIELAERVAYDAYFRPRAYSKDYGETLSEGARYKNVAERSMETTIRPLLRRAGALEAKSPGRPRKPKTKLPL